MSKKVIIKKEGGAVVVPDNAIFMVGMQDPDCGYVYMEIAGSAREYLIRICKVPSVEVGRNVVRSIASYLCSNSLIPFSVESWLNMANAKEAKK